MSEGKPQPLEQVYLYPGSSPVRRSTLQKSNREEKKKRQLRESGPHTLRSQTVHKNETGGSSQPPFHTLHVPRAQRSNALDAVRITQQRQTLILKRRTDDG